jgi:hypothetical protein
VSDETHDDADGGTIARERLGWGAELRDAIAPRTVLLVVGVLLLQLAFIVSYVGAFHDPQPKDIRLAVAAPGPAAASTVASLNDLAGTPLSARAAASAERARELVRTGEVSGALLVDPAGARDTLLVATGGGVTVATALEAILTRVEASQGRSVAVEDVVPLQDGDGRGLTAFYVVIGWIVGGYLAAALIGVAKGARSTNGRRAAIRVGAMVPYSVASGLGGALIVGPVLGALDGHTLVLAALGALLVFASAVVTMALQSLLGVMGIGAAVLVFVVLGNPSAGGAYQAELLPGFWRAIGQWLPNGAGTAAVRQLVYFAGRDTARPLLTIAIYAIVGAAATLAIGMRAGWSSRTDPASVGD